MNVYKIDSVQVSELDDLLWTQVMRIDSETKHVQAVWFVTSNAGDFSCYMLYFYVLCDFVMWINYVCPLYFIKLHLIFLKHPLLY